jgi:hypothetical protein
MRPTMTKKPMTNVPAEAQALRHQVHAGGKGNARTYRAEHR